jgi:hypothetical protein
MKTRVAVVVPGIMGSVLYYANASGQRHEIWSENFLQNYDRLLSNPAVLRWNGRPAESSLLENIYVSHFLPFPKVRIWKKLLQHLEGHGEFRNDDQMLKYSYDWRQSLLETAQHLGQRLDQHANRLIGQQSVPHTDVRFVFLTHSMGGLVVRLALALNVLDPAAIDRIVHIGSPLEGAPVAFHSAYKSGSLPLLKELSDLFHWKNKEDFFSNLLDNVRSFPSIYQVMPPANQNYLFYTWSHRSNPLTEGCMPADKRQLANEAHQRLREAKEMIIKHNIETFSIYTESHHQRDTDLEYRVQQLGAPNPGYEVTAVHARTDRGDGTVPELSAKGSDYSCKPNPVVNVSHAYMCNNKKVVQLLPGIL